MMKLTKVAMALALATGVASSALASAPDERELWEMLKKSAMETKGMQKRIDTEETARILDPNVANP
jgi:hypothetical protein